MTPWTWQGMWRSCCGALWTVSGSPMPSRDGQWPGPLAAALWGLCCVRVSVPGGAAGGPCPGDLLCAAPKCRLASGSLVFMPLYKRQRICRMVFLYVPFKRPSFGFPLLQAPAPQPPLLPVKGLLGAGAGGPASGLLSQSSLRMYVSPSCSTPWLRSQGVCGRTRLWHGVGGQPGLPPGPCWHSAPQQQGLLPDLVSSSGPLRMRDPLWLLASVSPARAGATRGRQGTRAPSEGGQAVWVVWGERSLLPPHPPASPLALAKKFWGPGHVIFLSQSK